jgi:hypothetical protein
MGRFVKREEERAFGERSVRLDGAYKKSEVLRPKKSVPRVMMKISGRNNFFFGH